MAEPNDASRKSKAEGERWMSDSESSSSERNYDSADRSGYESTDERAGGSTNRSLDEEICNQESLPSRGESKPGAHAGRGESMADESSSDSRRSER